MTIIRGISINDDQQVPVSKTCFDTVESKPKPANGGPVKVNVTLASPELPAFASFVDTLNTPTLINVNEFEYTGPVTVKTETIDSMEKDTVDINSLPSLWTIDDMTLEESVSEESETGPFYTNTTEILKKEIKTEPHSPVYTTQEPSAQSVRNIQAAALESYQSDAWIMDERINCAVERLNIPVDPELWSQYEVQKWAKYVLKEYNIEVSHIEGLEVDGTRMCMMSQEAFTSLFRVPEYGQILYVELDMWKNYSSISSPREQLTYTDLSASLPQAQIPTEPTSNISMTTLLNLPLAVTTSMELDGSFNSQSSYSSSSTVSSGVSSSISSSYPQTVPVLNSPMSEPEQMTQLSPVEPINQLPQIPIPNISALMGTNGATLQHSVDIPRPSTLSPADSGFSSGHDSEEETMDDDQTTESVGHATTGRHTIHLWKFLRELLEEAHLHNYCIKWLDREKGVFKIENSSAVAKLWGQRKNRPAMNYDKLSRSIRQYYKKGIIKKTSNSRRLVYQFCPNYL